MKPILLLAETSIAVRNVPLGTFFTTVCPGVSRVSMALIVW